MATASCLDGVWLGGDRLPISDLQHVPSCFTFSSCHVAAQSPVMGSAEASDSPNCCLEEGPEWGSLPSPGLFGLDFTVALSCLKTLQPRTFVMTSPFLVLPSWPATFTPQSLKDLSELTLLWTEGLGNLVAPER